jgi:ornithine cyclodeaminase/alanine dehydrogenase-like protein (mu-crystallin family)
MAKIVLIDKSRVESVIADRTDFVKNIILESLKTHFEKRLVLPTKQYVQRSNDAHAADRIIAMPVFLPEPHNIAGIKWIGSHPENFKRGMERANAFIILNDITTNAPIAIIDGSLISSMRTLAMTLICIDRFAPAPAVVACLGMGRLGKLHGRYLPRLYPSIRRIQCFSAAGYEQLLSDPVIKKCASAREALDGADVVITATAKDKPYVASADVKSAKLIVNLSLNDLSLEVFADSDTLVVDDIEQCKKAKKVFKKGVDEGVIDPSLVHELSGVLYGDHKGRDFPGRVLVNPIGMAVEDVLVAKAVYDRLRDDPGVPTFEI